MEESNILIAYLGNKKKQEAEMDVMYRITFDQLNKRFIYEKKTVIPNVSTKGPWKQVCDLEYSNSSVHKTDLKKSAEECVVAALEEYHKYLRKESNKN